MRSIALAAVVAVLALSPVSPTSSASQARTGVLVVAHGGSAAWNAPVEAAVARAGKQMPAEVGFLMGAGQKPQAAYAALVGRGVTSVTVVPLMVSSFSGHAEQIKFIAGVRPDYPHAEHMQLTALKGPVPVKLAAALDDAPIVAAILADRAKELSRAAGNEALVLVAHGPNEDDEAAKWMATMERLAKQIRQIVPFAHTELRLLRDDAPKPVKDQALAELRQGVVMQREIGRGVVVVPLLIAPGAVANQIPEVLKGLDFAWSGKTLLPDDRIADWILSRAR